MRVIGLLGGVACGKSLVAEQFRQQQFLQQTVEVLDGDRTGHEVLRMPEVIASAVACWGAGILGADGQIDRRQLAAVVFAPPPDGPRHRLHLEALTHPRIGQLLSDRLEAFRQSGRVAAVVLDAALLLDAGWDRLCDKIVFVDAPLALRQQRATARGWQAAELLAREEAQAALPRKRARADWIIDNSGTPAATALQVRQLWRSWIG